MATSPKLSCVPAIFFKDIAIDHTMQLEEWFPIAASLGVNGTEIHYRSLSTTDHASIHRIAGAVTKAGLLVSQLITATDFCDPDPNARATELLALTTAIEVASRLGATCVRVTAGQAHMGVDLDQAISWAVSGLRQVLPVAERKGVHLALENHYKDYFWEQPDVSRAGAVFMDMMRRLEDTPIRVNFDTGNPLMMNEDPLPMLASILERVVHVHCSDRIQGKYEHTICGQGQVDFRVLFHLLKESDYKGWLSVEYNGLQGLDGLRRSVDYVRETWQSA